MLSLLGKGLAAYRFGDQAKDYYDAIQFALSTIRQNPLEQYWDMNCRCVPGSLGGGKCMTFMRLSTNNNYGSCSAWNASNAGPSTAADPTTASTLYGFYQGVEGVDQQNPSIVDGTKLWVRTVILTRKAGAPVPTPIEGDVTVPYVVPAISPWARPAPDAAFQPAIDPNIWRAIPSRPARPISPVTSPNPFAPNSPSQGLVPMVLPTMRYEGQIGEPVPPIRGRPQPKKPPRQDPKKPNDPPVKERKSKAKSAAAVAALFAALDVVSEAAEVVDAFYEALPQHIKDEAEANARADGGLIDNAGQYGIDGADWKGQAVWDNWDLVDIDQALKNVVVNEMQDKFLGTIHQNTPANKGSAVDGGMKAANKAFEWAVGSFGW